MWIDKMDNTYNYKIIDETKKIIEICKNNRCFKFQLYQKRAFFVLVKLLDKYPDFMNIHEMDNDYHDPNKAFSDLKILEGFEVFILENKGSDRSISAKIDLDGLFKYFEANFEDNGNIIINPLSKDRNSISKKRQDAIYEKFKHRCNITGYKLYKQKPSDSLFMKSSLTPAYDHRRPIFRNGVDADENIQLISELANREKNKICLTCKNVDCENCALAYPEKFTVIKANNQDINDIIQRIKEEDS